MLDFDSHLLDGCVRVVKRKCYDGSPHPAQCPFQLLTICSTQCPFNSFHLVAPTFYTVIIIYIQLFTPQRLNIFQIILLLYRLVHSLMCFGNSNGEFSIAFTQRTCNQRGHITGPILFNIFIPVIFFSFPPNYSFSVNLIALQTQVLNNLTIIIFISINQSFTL